MNLQDLQRRQDRLTAEKAEIDAILDRLHDFGPDFEDGTVIRFTKGLRNGVGGRIKKYDYAARRCNGYWYTTGPVAGNTPRKWEDLVAWLISGESPTTHFQIAELWVSRIERDHIRHGIVSGFSVEAPHNHD